MRGHRLDADRGSLPLALLVIVALSLTVGALVTTVIGGTQAASFDQQYTITVQVADAGAQDGADRLIRGISWETLQAQSVPPGCGPATWSACPVFESGTGSHDGLPYSWEARKVSALAYHVRSTGTSRTGVERTVVVEVDDTPRFFLAAFADEGIVLRGGNSADSYGASAWFTGNGVVGSNESIGLTGASTGVDAVRLYNWDNNPDFGRCTHSGGSDCDDVLTVPDAAAPSARIGPKLIVGGERLETQFIDDQLAACPAPLTNYVASTYAGGSGTLGTAGTTTILCFQTFTADRDITILGDVEIYLAGDLLVSTHVDINCSGGCSVPANNPDARTLSFFVDGGTAAQTIVALGNHTTIAAGLYAPESDCRGNPSSAQANIFGSLICQSISTNGGWSFHYDDRLSSEGSGTFRTSAWREEQP